MPPAGQAPAAVRSTSARSPDLGECGTHQLPPAPGQHDEPGPAVPRVVDAGEVPTPFQRGDRLPHRLVGGAHPRGQRRHPRAVGRYDLEQQVLGRADPRVTDRLQPGEEIGDHRPVAPQEQRQLPPLEPVAQGPDTPWLFKGSDIPPDRSWTYGVLPNGLKYAVRRNGVPPGQVAIRVAIGAGSLMETDSERGFAHLIEHLSFRGSVHVPDGESKRVWQRRGVTFGSDSNASTSFTQTVYKLDLPSATPAGLDESMKILSGMMAEPTLTQAALDAERPVVLSQVPMLRLPARLRC